MYLRSGGGDGLDGGGAPVLPRPEGGGPVLDQLLPRAPHGPSGGAAMFITVTPPVDSPEGAVAISQVDALQLLTSFAASVHEPSTWPLKGARFDWTEDESSHAARRRVLSPMSAPEILSHAGILLLGEMLSRLPAVRTPEALYRWAQAARGLGRVLESLQMVALINQSLSFPTLIARIRSLILRPGSSLEAPLGRIKQVLDRVPEHLEGRAILWLLFGSAFPPDDEFARFWVHELGSSIPLLRASRVSQSDPLDLLSLIPVPAHLAKTVRTENSDAVSLRDFLFSALGSPGELLTDGKDGLDGIAVLLFAGCSLTVSEHDVVLPFAFFHATPDFSELQHDQLNRILSSGWSWLAGSLPRLAFPASLEQAIASASSLRYGAAESGMTRGGPGSPTQPLSPGPVVSAHAQRTSQAVRSQVASAG